MKMIVLDDVCISCGVCTEMCEDVFKFNDEGIAEVMITPIPGDKEEEAKEAMNSCPVDAIQEEK